jgi:hypothetical protein
VRNESDFDAFSLNRRKPYKLTKMKKQLFLTVVLALMLQLPSFGQSIKLNNEGDPGSAMLEVNSASKGILIPNVSLTGTTDAITIASPAVSLLVYNTVSVSDVEPGYYYNSGTQGSPVWTRLSTSTSPGPAGDGSETKVEAGTNVIVTGSGTSASPYVVGATVGDGSETKVTGGTNVDVWGSGTLASPYIVHATTSIPAYTIGLSADQGGYIFWVSTDGKHGLVAETIDQSNSSSWYYAQEIISNPSNHSADGDDFRDWRMPTKYELNEMYLQKVAIGGFSSGSYWSSTEVDYDRAMRQYFDDGDQWYYSKYFYYFYVRAVRAF